MAGTSGLKPVEYNVVVAIDAADEMTAGGIILPVSKRDETELAAETGVIDAVSPHAFTYADDWGDHPRPAVGDRVIFARYAGREREMGGRKYRIMQDKAILAVVEASND